MAVPEATGLWNPPGRDLKVQLEILKNEQEERWQTGQHGLAASLYPLEQYTSTSQGERTLGKGTL